MYKFDEEQKVYPTGKTLFSKQRPLQDEDEVEPIWVPNLGQQTKAVESEADILGYGGQAGGGKTDLLLGVAATLHKKSVIFRRVFPNLRGIIERSREIFNPEGFQHGKDSFNETLHRWSFPDEPGKLIEFESCNLEKDKEKQRGRDRDFYGFDEATEFTESQFRFITAWNRSVNKNQRCRIILTFNPPNNVSGQWVVEFFKPWLSYLYPETFPHHIQAKPGELLYYWTDEEGEEHCSREPGEGRVSRTFIPASLEDNPYLKDTNYGSILNSLPEPLRSQLLRGDFSASEDDDPMQVIPTAWVMDAIERWKTREKPEVPLTAVGVDAARGGKDNMVISKLYQDYVTMPEKIKGKEVPTGQIAAAKLKVSVGDEIPLRINIDLIGYGSSLFDFARDILPNVSGFNAAMGSEYTDKSKKLKMRNQRSEMYWIMRDELDPTNNPTLALPDDPELVADLCSARWKLTASGVLIEEKEEIKQRIGRSPDVGESVMILLWKDPNKPIPGLFRSGIAKQNIKGN